MKYNHISVAIPLLAERDNLPALVRSLKQQTISNFNVFCCVNNPEGWAESDKKEERSLFLNNQESLDLLKTTGFTVIDRSSPGLGWTGKQRGVGWARKVLFDTIATQSDDDELMVSLDADTSFSDTYLETVLDTLNRHPNHSALCVPYYHPLRGNENDDRAMLRYEIYMRHYLINLLESSNPYAFTALGSAMVFPLWAYRRVGGITPLQGGEDFYLMQKFAKTGSVLLHCDETVYPQGRPSSRVPFGTGPAIAKGLDFMNTTYPLYPYEGFRAVADTFALFPTLFTEEKTTPMSHFLQQQLKTDDLWQPLRKNFKTKELFVHACQERVDGLRILQFLKTFPLRPAEVELQMFCDRRNIPFPDNFSFQDTATSSLNEVRNAIYAAELNCRKKTIQ